MSNASAPPSDLQFFLAAGLYWRYHERRRSAEFALYVNVLGLRLGD
jgi:hypothetical protein